MTWSRIGVARTLERFARREISAGQLVQDCLERIAEREPVVQAWEVVRRSIEGRCLSPEYWVHSRVAYDLNRRPLPLLTTDDFAVWVFDFDAGQGELLEMFAFVLRPATFELLRKRRLIGKDEDATYLDESR